MSVSSDDSDITGPNDDETHTPTTRGVVDTVLSRINDQGARSFIRSNVFYHLAHVKSRFFDDERCIETINAAMTDIERMEDTHTEGQPASGISKELAKKWIHHYYAGYEFEGFRVPLGEDFVVAIPDLLEIPHVKLDYTSQIIYYNVLLQGLMLSTDECPGRGGIVQYLYNTCMTLVDGWLDNVKHTPADLYAAFLMLSMMLEGCNSELSWKIFGQACTIARALGYFSVDENPAFPDNPTKNDTEVEKNRKRFEFWHLLRTDCVFRLSFGKPACIQKGSWTVNLPDPSINGVENESTRFIQIHFLASMRLNLVALKYLELVDSKPDPETEAYDKTIDSLIAEVQSIMSDWNTEELSNTTTNHVDMWFCMDVLFSSYQMLIIFYQSKKCNQGSDGLPHRTVDIAKKSLQTFQSLLASAHKHAHFGISLILLHQFVPFFILSLNIIGSPERQNVEADIALIVWASETVKKAAEERGDLRPIRTVMAAMALACQRANPGAN
ncbi:hypothetical protein SI65_07822 [Aspergillus cristatus]|uniref:Xylanolytic transcriptional activator regulatory domain-containing protein n=1 Tax=Aspergillus cristatus TaxID=573508 RepID=A0A1E3B7E5_ASPCR|nr:hypothetical protein SI65_07822 [Aspergillus cristatus]